MEISNKMDAGQIISAVRGKTKLFDNFEFNTSQTTATIRWEAFKAFIRGQIISYTSRKTKEAQDIIRDLESKMKMLENKRLQNENEIS